MENKGFGWSSMKYLKGCRIAVSANRQAWTVLWGCSKRRAFWKRIGGLGLLAVDPAPRWV